MKKVEVVRIMYEDECGRCGKIIRGNSVAHVVYNMNLHKAKHISKNIFIEVSKDKQSKLKMKYNYFSRKFELVRV